MLDARPSRTALAAAAHRAAHQTEDDTVLFADPLAKTVLGEDPGADAGLLGGRPMRALICARARLAEDALAEAVGQGVDQYLLLGAGLDTFAWRNPHPGLTVIEADRPGADTWKRSRLGAPAGRRLFAAVDLERDAVLPALLAAGLDPARPVFAACLGVTPYLGREAVLGLLGALRSLAGGAEIVFDYGPPATSLTGTLFRAYERRAARVAAAGEPWRTAFEPHSLADDLGRIGFSTIKDLGPDQINDRYFGKARGGLRVLTGRIVRAA